MTDLDTLLAELRTRTPAAIIDRAATALAEVGEAASILSARDDYDTVSLWGAAGTLSSAYAAVLPYTSIDLPDPPNSPGPLADIPERMIDLLDAAADALVHAARTATDPDLIYALTTAGNLTEQARHGLANAMAAV